MPTIWRAPRSSACAPTAKASRARPRRPALTRRRRSRCAAVATPAANPPVVANAPAAVNAPALRPLPPPIMVSGSPAARPYGQAPPQARPPYAGQCRAIQATVRPRPPIFRSRARSICALKRPSLPCASALRRPPRTCCRRRSRSSTRCCRNSRLRQTSALGLDPGQLPLALGSASSQLASNRFHQKRESALDFDLTRFRDANRSPLRWKTL